MSEEAYKNGYAAGWAAREAWSAELREYQDWHFCGNAKCNMPLPRDYIEFDYCPYCGCRIARIVKDEE